MSSANAKSNAADWRVVMVGTSPMTMGGIATVVQGYRDAGLFERAPIDYVPTHRDGTVLQKLRAAVTGYLRILWILLRRRRIILHVHLSSRASFWRKLPIFWLGRLTGKRYIIHLHGSEFMTFHDSEAGALGKRLIQSAFDKATLVLALSPEWQANVAGFTQNQNIRVLPNAVPVADVCPEHGSASGPVCLLFLGRLGWRKGIYDLLAALAEVHKQGIRFELIAAGDGEIDKVRASAKKLGLGDAVQVPGWIGSNAKQELLAKADIFVLPSHAEGLPMSLLEAMAAGLPVVCSTVGGIPLAVTDEHEGLLVPPGDVERLRSALLRLLESRELRTAFSRRAHARAKSEFSVDSCVTRLLEIYAEMGVNVSQGNAGDAVPLRANSNQ